MDMIMVAPSIRVHGNTTPQKWQGVDSFHSNLVEGAIMGMVDVLKVGDTWPTWNLHMGGVQIMTEWKVHATPLGVSGLDGVFKTHPRGWLGLVGCLCPGLQLHVKCGPFEGWVCSKVDLFAWTQTLGVENNLLKD